MDVVPVDGKRKAATPAKGAAAARQDAQVRAECGSERGAPHLGRGTGYLILHFIFACRRAFPRQPARKRRGMLSTSVSHHAAVSVLPCASLWEHSRLPPPWFHLTARPSAKSDRARSARLLRGPDEGLLLAIWRGDAPEAVSQQEDGGLETLRVRRVQVPLGSEDRRRDDEQLPYVRQGTLMSRSFCSLPSVVPPRAHTLPATTCSPRLPIPLPGVIPRGFCKGYFGVEQTVTTTRTALRHDASLWFPTVSRFGPLVFLQVLKVHVVPPSEVHKDTFKGTDKPFKPVR